MEEFVHDVELSIKMKKFLSSFLLLLSSFCFSVERPERLLAYDANGNVTGYTIPHAGEIAYSYDPINRLTDIHYPSGETVKYVYDYNSNLTKVVQGSETTSYSYDRLNRLVKAQFPGDVLVSYDYDPANRLVKITYPDKEVVGYSYDHRGRLVKVLDPVGSTQYEYDDQTNLVVKERLPNGIVTEYSYDAVPRITAVSHKNSNGALIAEYQFVYDKNNNCRSVREVTHSETKTTSYLYDNLNRLTEVVCSNKDFEKYTYDGAGNRLTKITRDGTVDYEYDNYNRLIRAGEARLYYDASGNLIKKTSNGKEICFGYDAAGRLVSSDNGKDQVIFVYDGEGRRVSKSVNGKKTSFINDPVAPLSRVLLEKDEHGQTKKRYVYGFSRLLGQGTAGAQFFLYDQPGKSVSFLVDKNQRVLKTYSYSAFGLRNGENRLENSYEYAGEEYDEETGLVYLRNRYYDPEIGRFISPDSVVGNLGDPQTLNPYAYVRNNPVNYIDPSGLYAVKVPLTFYGNFPSTRTPGGKSRLGHGWVGGLDIDGNEFNQGAWPGSDNTIHDNENEMSFCKETVSLTVWVPPEQQQLARQAGNYAHWTPRDNCIDHVVKSLDAVGYPHPSFKPLSVGISSPAIFCNWIIEENKHIDARFLLGADDIVPYKFTSQQPSVGDLSYSFLSQPNYGGVSLSKTAELMTHISDIAGAVFDEKMGQIILYGSRDLALPDMHLDDLAVAVRSVYGLGGGSGQDPGISLDLEIKRSKKEPSRMIVTYYGETRNTHFGQVMFDADRLLKNLIIGKDNLTQKTIGANVAGYKNLLEYSVQGLGNGFLSCRMWFVPEKISLVQSADGTSMLFDQVRMQVLTESKFHGSPVQDLAAEKFATHFTQHYEDFSYQYPVLDELKRLGKITAVVKWIKDHDLPFDLAFFKDYTPHFMNTPSFTNEITTGDIIHGKVIILNGGVVYHLDNKNFFTTTGRQADEVKEKVLQARSSEEQLIWGFGNGYTAVA